MKRNYVFYLLALFASVNIFAQGYTSPNTGDTYTLNDIALADSSTLVKNGTSYTLLQDLTIAENDALEVTESINLAIAEGVRITIDGTLNWNPPTTGATVDALTAGTTYDGFWFGQTSNINITNSSFMNGGGFKVITPNFYMENCTVMYMVSGASTGAAISLSRGAPVIENNLIMYNDLPAIASGANQTVSATIRGNYIEGNTKSNQNRPQLNLSITGTDTLRVINNDIIGDVTLDEVGGIAISNFIGDGAEIRAIIQGNTIENNRYGITISGNNVNALIKDNTIEDNNTQGLPYLGGSGISLNSSDGTQTVVARNNYIKGNLWGITLRAKGRIDLGTADDYGHNTFSENGNNNTSYSLYNNTPNNITAIYNCWEEGVSFGSAADVDQYIVHANDDASLGTVTFEPFDCASMNIDTHTTQVNFYPNPSQDVLTIENTQGFDTAAIYNLNGQLVTSYNLNEGTNTIRFALTTGVYFIKFNSAKNKGVTKKLLVQ